MRLPTAEGGAEASAEGMTVRLLPSPAAEDAGLAAELADLINRVYAAAEDGLWVPGTPRTDTAEIAGHIRAGETAVAESPEGTIVGCVRIQRPDDRACEFGTLAVPLEYRGIGAGRLLVRFAEQYARDTGCDTMQLELLVPRGWTHPSKEFLTRWYGRLGYRMVRTGVIDEFYPDLAPLLATACDFVVYRKPLLRSPEDAEVVADAVPPWAYEKAEGPHDPQ